MDDNKHLVIIILASAAISIAAGLAGERLVTGCQRETLPEIKTSATTSTSSVASQSVKITIRRPDKQTQQHCQEAASHNAQEGPLAKVVRLFHPSKQAIGLNEPHSGHSVDLGNSQPQDEEIIIEMGQSMASNGSASASASIEPAKNLQNVESSFGLLVGTLPGYVALDYRVANLGSLGIDLAANHKAIAAGVSVGDRIFGMAGGYQDYSGEGGLMAGAGMRF